MFWITSMTTWCLPGVEEHEVAPCDLDRFPTGLAKPAVIEAAGLVGQESFLVACREPEAAAFHGRRIERHHTGDVRSAETVG